MNEVTKRLPVKSNDQLYHILKTDTFTFCLICLKDINSTCDDVGKHLNSTSHVESIKCLFKACNPSLIDDIEDERFVTLVSKLVFDISVLLGNETCYVTKKDNCWFCLMCEQNVSQRSLDDAVVKDNIIDHVLSESHVKKVKGVCFLYRLNDNQDFLLLNKSVVYCSVCKDAMKCEEVGLLKAAVFHLDLKHPNYAVSDGFQYETSSFFHVEENTHKTIEEAVVDRLSSNDTQTMSRTEVAGDGGNETLRDTDKNLVEIVRDISVQPIHNDIKETFSNESFFNTNNVCVCCLCKARVKPVRGERFVLSVASHFQQLHKNEYINQSLDDLVNSVIFHKNSETIKPLSRKIKMTKHLTSLLEMKRETKTPVNNVFMTETDYFCIICMVSMCRRFHSSGVLLDHFQKHFNSASHEKCEKEIKELNHALKAGMIDETIKQIHQVQQMADRKEWGWDKPENSKKRARNREEELQQSPVCKAKLKCEKVDFLENSLVNFEVKRPKYAVSNDSKLESSSLIQEENKISEHVVSVGGTSSDYVNNKSIRKTELAADVDINCESLIEIATDISMLNSNGPNHVDVNKFFNEEIFFKDNNICVCLLCKKRVEPLAGRSVIFPINNHFKREHRTDYIKVSPEELINCVTFHNDPDEIKLLSNVKHMKKSVRILMKRRYEVKSHVNSIFQADEDYFCIFCMAIVCPCLDDKLVVMEHFANHFNSASHYQCKKEKMKINQAFRVSKNNEIVTKLRMEKDSFKKVIKRTHNEKKGRRAQNKLLNAQIKLRGLKEKQNFIKQVKKEVL